MPVQEDRERKKGSKGSSAYGNTIKGAVGRKEVKCHDLAKRLSHFLFSFSFFFSFI